MIETDLPVSSILDTLRDHLARHDAVVLQAPPGSGKTTIAPLVLMEEAWLGHRKILLLEPRRIAARAAAWRMAQLLGEEPGGTIGYRMRLDTRVSSRTRLEVITEGILTRMLQEDPSLADVGLVIFDEFHERSLDADLALSLCIKGRALFRGADDPLKLLVMSATLDTEKLERLLHAPVIHAEGRQYPVEVIYVGATGPRDNIIERVVTTTIKALRDHPRSSLLVFLPGQGEIARCKAMLEEATARNRLAGVQLRPMFGNLTIEEQQAAIAPVESSDWRKVVLATNIAETSLTIEGVDVVIDAGTVREPVYDPATAMTRLHTRRISRASSEQRAGRAGRLRPGTCYRLWSPGQQHELAAHAEPEILNADLTPLALQLFEWGVASPAELEWLDPPPQGAWQEAVSKLTEFGAIDSNQHLTTLGANMANLPVHPRLARMMICGAAIGEAQLASLLAAAISERNPLAEDDPDLSYTVSVLNGETQCPAPQRGWLTRTRQLASQYAKQLAALPVARRLTNLEHAQLVGYLVACAYPDRIARKRHGGDYLLANGRAASLADHAFGGAPWIAIADVGGLARRKGDIIRAGAVLDAMLFETELSDRVAESTVVEWDKREKRFVAEHRAMVGSLVLKREKLKEVPIEARQEALVNHVREAGIAMLPWSPRLRQWQARVALLRAVSPELELPDVSDVHLAETLADWLGPWLADIKQLNDFARLDLASILAAMLTFEQRRELDRQLPERIEVPSGSSYAIDYTRSPPVLAVKLQEMFGAERTPAVAGGKVTLAVHLLSPAGRPVQVTQDLAGFWRTTYHDVKKDMKGRYPRHPWPDDPLAAPPTRHTKPRGS